MSSQDYPPATYPAAGVLHPQPPVAVWMAGRARPRYWLHVLLILLTLLTTAGVGSRLAYNFRHDLPAFTERDFFGFAQFWVDPSVLVSGLPFALTLLAILLAHEFGHYFACGYYGVDASLPYFLPSPTLIGTMGAFIRIRTPIYSRRALFDVGFAGPIAGFLVLLPVLIVGVAMSKVAPGIAASGDLVFGTPALIWILERLAFPDVAASDIYLHPVARAAWVGIFATALNLLPIGQLDGGHILYAFSGGRHKLFSRIFVAALVPMGIFYWPWLLWAAFLLIFGMRHPAIYDQQPLGRERTVLGWVALAIFLLCFMLAPVETNGVG